MNYHQKEKLGFGFERLESYNYKFTTEKICKVTEFFGDLMHIYIYIYSSI